MPRPLRLLASLPLLLAVAYVSHAMARDPRASRRGGSLDDTASARGGRAIEGRRALPSIPQRQPRILSRNLRLLVVNPQAIDPLGRPMGAWIDLPYPPESLGFWLETNCLIGCERPSGSTYSRVWVADYELPEWAIASGLSAWLMVHGRGRLLPLPTWNLLARLGEGVPGDSLDAMAIASVRRPPQTPVELANLVEQASTLPWHPYSTLGRYSRRQMLESRAELERQGFALGTRGFTSPADALPDLGRLSEDELEERAWSGSHD